MTAPGGGVPVAGDLEEAERRANELIGWMRLISAPNRSGELTIGREDAAALVSAFDRCDARFDALAGSEQQLAYERDNALARVAAAEAVQGRMADSLPDQGPWQEWSERDRAVRDYEGELSDALAVENDPLHEVECPQCGATIRARMADQLDAVSPRDTDADELLLVRKPGRMSGRPTVGHSRLPLSTLLEYLRAGDSPELVQSAYPSVTAGQMRVVAALRADLDDRDEEELPVSPREDETPEPAAHDGDSCADMDRWLDDAQGELNHISEYLTRRGISATKDGGWDFYRALAQLQDRAIERAGVARASSPPSSYTSGGIDLAPGPHDSLSLSRSDGVVSVVCKCGLPTTVEDTALARQWWDDHKAAAQRHYDPDFRLVVLRARDLVEGQDDTAVVVDETPLIGTWADPEFRAHQDHRHAVEGCGYCPSSDEEGP